MTDKKIRLFITFEIKYILILTKFNFVLIFIYKVFGGSYMHMLIIGII